jgi:cell division septation protein DedD
VNKFGKWLKKCFVPHEGNEFKPHFLRHQSITMLFLLVMVFELGFLVQIFVIFNKTDFLAAVLPGVLTTLTNQERADNGVAPLKENTLLDQAAQDKANDMAENGYFAHTSPSGLTPWYWFQKVGYNFQYAGENLAVNFFESDQVAEAWMNSPTHRANIVKPEYTEIGIGVAQGYYQGHSTVFVAQLFGTPLVFAAAPENPTPAPKTTTASAPAPAPAPKTETSKPATTTPKTNPAPAPAPSPEPSTTPAPAETPTSVAEAPQPIGVEVLGDQTATAPVSTDVTVAPESPVASFFAQALSSPRKSITFAYLTIVALVLMTLIILFIESERRHPAMVARGLGLVAAIIVLTFINLKMLNIKTLVPTDDHNFTAAAVLALPQ